MSLKCDLESRVCFVKSGVQILWEKMPSDMVSFAVTTGFGVSLVAGIISGICYIVAHGSNKKSRKPAKDWNCQVCGVYLRSIDGILEGDRVVTCSKCQTRVCKQRCSELNSEIGGWLCNECRKTTDSWFQSLFKIIQPNSKVTVNTSKMNVLDKDLETLRNKEKAEIRDFIERLVNAMLGENVDDANVSKLYRDKQYESIFDKYHQDLSNTITELGSALHISIANLPNGQTPYTAHAQLKLFIERLIRDAQDLPKLTRNDQYDVPSEDNNRTYEDLLSTAIINKVITNYQNNPNRPSSSANSVSSRLSSSSRTRDDNIFFGEETLDSKWKTTDLETSSVSSLESWIQSDSNLGSSKYVDKVTLTIRQNIDDVHNTDSEEDEEGDNDSTYFRTKSSLLSDDDPNWHLQKRQFVGTNSPVPVPMLVPDPTGDAKVLIGDKEIDETSDLSDIASDYGDTENVPEMKNILIESKTVIGGKNLLDSFTASDGELSADSGVKEDKYFDGYSSNNPTEDGDYIVQAINIAKADKSVDDDNVEDASIISLYSNTEKDTEYTEKYATLPRTIMKPDSNFNSEKENLSVEETKHKHSNEDHDDYEYINGSYSKKEKDKWKHPIKMENNPYSKENIEKRLNRSNSSVSSLFGSDYYKRQASAPAGTKKRQEVSYGAKVGNIEEDYVYSSLPRSLYSPRNSSKNFVQNPLLNFPDTYNSL